VILKDETATYDSELREVQLKHKHEIINFINMLLSISDEVKSERQKLLKSLDSVIKSQNEEIGKIKSKYGLKTEILSIGSVLHQIIFRHLNFDAMK